MKKIVILCLSAFLSYTAAIAQDQVPAFPGAEGHGRYVTGGRGGKVIHVTNLNDSGTGSLRAAVSGNAKKIIVFDVGGIIELKSELVFGDNTTIAGQTAPNPGITLRYYTVRPGGNNIVRFIRIRRGEEKDVNDGADATWQRGKSDMVLDHCSFSWSIDEIASFYDNRDFTMQWCTVGEALANPGHGKGEHSYGGIWGGKNASFHHNFLAHMQNRVPRFCGARYGDEYAKYDKTKYANPIQAEIVDFRNCVMYNWGNGNGCYGGTGGGQINIVNNYYKAGPATVNKTRVTQVSVATSSNAEGSPYLGYTSRYYINGNYVTAAGSNAENYDWKGVKYDSGTYEIDGDYCCADEKHLYGDNVTYYKNANGIDCVRIKMESPVSQGEVTTHTAQNAYEKVLSHAGASLYRDQVDARYMEETKNGTATYTGSQENVAHRPGIIDFVKDQGQYILTEGGRPEGFDSDNDGMPDVWETANGLNPNDPSDANLYTIDNEKKWYSNLEVYLNSLVEDIMKAGNSDALSSVDEYYPTCNKVDLPSTGGDNGNTNPNPDQTTAATVTWAFNSGREGQAAEYSTNATACLEADKVTLGSSLSYNGTQGLDGVTETKIRATVPNESSATDDNAVTFTFSTKSGYKFQATKVSFIATRLGTDGGKLDAYWKDAGGNNTLTTGQTPNRNNDANQKYTTYTFTQFNSTATEGECSLIINIYALGQVKDDGTQNLKDYGLGNISVSGTLTQESSGIRQTDGDITLTRTYYNIWGQRLSAPEKGVNIVVEKKTDGTTRTRKTVVR